MVTKQQISITLFAQPKIDAFSGYACALLKGQPVVRQPITLHVLATFCLYLAEQSCIVQILLLHLHDKISCYQVLAVPGHLMVACQQHAGSNHGQT